MSFSLISPTISIDFVSLRYKMLALSVTCILCGLLLLLYKGSIPLGIDFSGGTVVQIVMENSIETKTLREKLGQVYSGEVLIQAIGNDYKEYLLRFPPLMDQNIGMQEIMEERFSALFPNEQYNIIRIESVGPKVGADIQIKAIEAIYYALLIIAVYISGRFESRWIPPLLLICGLSLFFFTLRLFSVTIFYIVPISLLLTIILFFKLKLSFALGAILSILHDLAITCTILLFTGISFDLTIVAALLTIIGYSLNDTIIIYDRIREITHTTQCPINSKTCINTSINSTLSRTIITSLTTLFALFSLIFLGGEILFPFAFTMFIGIVVGTYSSIFIASPILLFFGINPPQEKEKIILDEHGTV
ncbi:MAG: protein translocase subunit SecF [Desulfovibrionaceae bacterium]